MHDFQDGDAPVMNKKDINREKNIIKRNNSENNSERNINERSNNTRNSCKRYSFSVISLIIVILAIITYQYLPSSEILINKFSFEEFMKYVEKLGFGFDIFKLPSNEEINRNIINCTSLAHRVEQSVAFNNTGSELVESLNKFSSQLEITKSSYTKMYTDGIWFIWNLEQFINDTLNYISNESFMSFINRNMDNNLHSSIKGSIEALNNFHSSVEKAYEATLTADEFRNDAHKQVVKAKEEVEKFIHNSNNPSFRDKIRKSINSIFDKTEENNLAVDIKIATSIENFLNYVDNDLGRIAKVLLDFKTKLENHSSTLLKLKANVEPLKKFKWGEHDIKTIRELLNMIKENHKNFKSRVYQ